jgi:hypothetical protein
MVPAIPASMAVAAKHRPARDGHSPAPPGTHIAVEQDDGGPGIAAAGRSEWIRGLFKDAGAGMQHQNHRAMITDHGERLEAGIQDECAHGVLLILDELVPGLAARTRPA